jgi:RES domain-containing protein
VCIDGVIITLCQYNTVELPAFCKANLTTTALDRKKQSTNHKQPTKTLIASRVVFPCAMFELAIEFVFVIVIVIATELMIACMWMTDQMMKCILT